jgi:hypothetical protein
LTTVLVAVALSGALSSCSASPPAATVNGRVISQGQLDQYLEEWSSSPAYVQRFQAASEQESQEAAAQGQQEPAFTVQGTGSGPDDYSLVWATGRLTLLVSAAAVHQYLERRREAPSPLEVAAAWASEDAANAQMWQQLPALLRAQVAEQDAEHALIEPKLSDLSGDRALYKADSFVFWTQVCLRTVDVSVPGPGGGTDMAASYKQAEEVAGELDGTLRAASGPPVTSGALYCLSPEQLLEQPPAFRQQVGALEPGKAAPVAESYGYKVVQVRSRVAIPFNKSVASDIEVVASASSSQAPAWPVVGEGTDTSLIKLLKATTVQVNPLYGSWTAALPAPYIPQVWPAGAAAPT